MLLAVVGLIVIGLFMGSVMFATFQPCPETEFRVNGMPVQCDSVENCRNTLRDLGAPDSYINQLNPRCDGVCHITSLECGVTKGGVQT